MTLDHRIAYIALSMITPVLEVRPPATTRFGPIRIFEGGSFMWRNPFVCKPVRVTRFSVKFTPHTTKSELVVTQIQIILYYPTLVQSNVSRLQRILDPSQTGNRNAKRNPNRNQDTIIIFFLTILSFFVAVTVTLDPPPGPSLWVL